MSIAMNFSSSIALSLLFLFLLQFSITSANPLKICDSTPYPSSCTAVLPSGNSSTNVYDYGRISIGKSISAARKFLALINRYTEKSIGLTVTAVRALQDCRVLTESTIDYLVSSSQIVNGTSRVLPLIEADQVQSLMSAILTNTQTCIDGLEATASEWSFENGVMAPLLNDSRLYSVSLALVSKGWLPKFRRWPGNIPVFKKKLKRPIKGNGRRMLQDSGSGDGGDEVLVRDMVTVNQDGSGNFTAINDAVNSAPVNSNGTNGFYVIYVAAGVYEEYVVVPRNRRYVMMIGDGINRTIITGNRSVIDGWTTFGSSTFTVSGMGFVAMNITFRNTAGAIKQQAVAVRNNADLSTFYRCSFEGYQDTLYAHSLRQFYAQCDIYGTVDFIFGNAAAVFQGCNVYSKQPLPGQFNSITAQGRTDPNQNTGFSLQNCSLRASDDLATSTYSVRTYLGRPWKQYSRTIFMNCYMERLIHPNGWSVWSGDFALDTCYYGEYNNFGPGSDTSRRVTWAGFHVIDSTDAANFTASTFLVGDEWLPGTGVPYTGGLA